MASRDQLHELASRWQLRPALGESEDALRARIGTQLRRDGFKGNAQELAAKIDELATSRSEIQAATRPAERPTPVSVKRPARDTRAAVAYRQALARLAEAHVEEFAGLVREERVARGLPADREAKPAAVTKADLLAEVAALRARLGIAVDAPIEAKADPSVLACSCGRSFASRQALGGHRGRRGCR